MLGVLTVTACLVDTGPSGWCSARLGDWWLHWELVETELWTSTGEYPSWLPSSFKNWLFSKLSTYQLGFFEHKQLVFVGFNFSSPFCDWGESTNFLLEAPICDLPHTHADGWEATECHHFQSCAEPDTPFKFLLQPQCTLLCCCMQSRCPVNKILSLPYF